MKLIQINHSFLALCIGPINFKALKIVVETNAKNAANENR